MLGINQDYKVLNNNLNIYQDKKKHFLTPKKRNKNHPKIRVIFISLFSNIFKSP